MLQKSGRGMGSQQRCHDLLCPVVRGARIRTKEGERLISFVSCTWPGSRCSTMGLYKSRDTHKNTRGSRSRRTRLLTDLKYKSGQMNIRYNLFSPCIRVLRVQDCSQTSNTSENR